MPDAELGTGGVGLVRGVEAQVRTDLRTGKARVGDHLVLDDMTEIDQAHVVMMTEHRRRTAPQEVEVSPIRITGGGLCPDM